MPCTNEQTVNKALALYLEFGGRQHRLIESIMRTSGHPTFCRRVFYDRQRKGETIPGWVTKFGWNDLLSQQQGAVAAGPPASPDEKPHGRPRTFKLIREYYRLAQSHSVAAYTINKKRDGAVTANGDADRSEYVDFQKWLKAAFPNMTWHWRHQLHLYGKLKAVTDGTVKRLAIFMPPRHGKSELVTVKYAAHRLFRDPSLNIIVGSYNQRLANRFSRKIRLSWEDACQRLNPKRNDSTEQHETKTASGNTSVPGLSPSGSRSAAGVTSPGSESEPVQPTFSRPRRLNTVAEWETGIGGSVRAVGVGGGITGFGADLVIIDDPIKSRAEAESKTFRDKIYEWFNDDLYTRLEPNASIILIQTRWHEDDLAGRLLKEMENGGEHWEVISLPALAEKIADKKEEGSVIEASRSEPDVPPHLLPAPPSFQRPRLHLYSNDAEWKAWQEYDKAVEEIKAKFLKEQAELVPGFPALIIPRSNDPLNRPAGEALCPERYTREELLKIKQKLGSYSFSALYQQRPTPPEGGLFKLKWFAKIIDKAPEGLRWCRGYDLAVSTRTTADYTASFRCALDKEGILYIADGFRKRMEFPDQRRYILDKIRAERNSEHGIEQALHGMAFIQELRREEFLAAASFRAVPVSADKFTRALAWANRAEEGKVILVRGHWIDDFLEELSMFPNGRHDDQIDAVSIAVQMLQRRRRIGYGF